jgi:hypothetical protein
VNRFQVRRVSGLQMLKKYLTLIGQQLALSLLIVVTLMSVATAKVSDLFTFEQQQTDALETQALNDATGAATAAKQLKRRLQSELETNNGFATKAQEQTKQWQQLTKDAENDAEINAQRAADARQEARTAVLSASEKAERIKQAEFWEEQEQTDRQRAESRKQRASQSQAEAESFRDAQDLLNNLIQRLDKVLDAATKQTAAQEKQKQEEAEYQANKPPEPEKSGYRLSLKQSLGLWRAVDDNSRVFAIVQANPETGKSYDLQLHSNDKIWQGTYDPSLNRAEKLRKATLRFTYTPSAGEMNPEIPLWARESIAGKLVWKLDLDETGSALEPNLSAKFYRGSVRWHDGEEQWAKIEGEGPPKIFEMAVDSIISLNQSDPTLLLIGPDNQTHNVLIQPIESVAKKQPLRVRVIASSDTSKEIGSALKVQIRNVKSGAKTSLTLQRSGITKDNRVIYTHKGPITIANSGDAPDREYKTLALPPRRMLGWLADALGVEGPGPGSRLNLSTENGNEIEFKYEDSYQRITVYNSWVQQALARYDSAINRMAATYGGILESNKAEKIKIAVRDKLRLLSNYQLMRRSDDLTDKHRLALAEMYIGEHGGRQLLGYTKEQLTSYQNKITSDYVVGGSQSGQDWLLTCGSKGIPKIAPDAKSSSSSSEEVGEKLQRNAMQAVGLDMSINAIKGIKGIPWTHDMERQCAERVVVKVSEKGQSLALKDYGVAITYGLYEGYASATGANDIAVAFFETDIYGNKVPAYSLPWWISTLSIAGNVAVSADEVMTFSRRRTRSENIWQAALSDESSQSWSKLLREDYARRMTKRVPASLGTKNAQRTLIKSPQTVGKEVAEDFTEAIANNLPGSLSTSQRQQLHHTLLAGDDIARELPVDISFKDAFPGNNTLHGSNRNAINSYYQNQAVLSRRAAMPEFCTQVPGERACEGVSANFMMYWFDGTPLSEPFAHGQIGVAYAHRRAAGSGMSLHQAFDEFIVGSVGVDMGYSYHDIFSYLRSRGYEPHVWNPAANYSLGLNHIENMTNQGFLVRTVIRPPSSPNSLHAVVVGNVSRNPQTGLIDTVRFFCPSEGRMLKMKADVFDSWLAREWDGVTAYAVQGQKSTAMPIQPLPRLQIPQPPP